jgi:ATP-dependent Zn protease
MKSAIRRLVPALTLVSPALAVLALSVGTAAGAVKYSPESFSEYETQLTGGQIHEVTINKRLRTVRVTLNDGRHVLAKYAPGEEPRVRSELEAKHVAVSVLNSAQAKPKSTKPVHHKLRYIAGGILIAIVVIVGGVWLYNRRRQAAAG